VLSSKLICWEEKVALSSFLLVLVSEGCCNREPQTVA
jgi:hypothetical protein